MYDSIYMILPKRQNHKDQKIKNKIDQWLSGAGSGRKRFTINKHKEFFGVMELFIILVLVTVT